SSESSTSSFESTTSHLPPLPLTVVLSSKNERVTDPTIVIAVVALAFIVTLLVLVALVFTWKAKKAKGSR
ncbi:hypothetical protein OSTOST_14961, partial [Ostertagia ostertagi]